MNNGTRKPTASERPPTHESDGSVGAPRDTVAPGSAGAGKNYEDGDRTDEAAMESVSGEVTPDNSPSTAETGEDPADTIARLENEKADLTDRLLRVVAEMDNLRKRSERELADARKFSVAALAGDMLNVGDNLRRALEAVPAEARDAGDETLDALLSGVEVTEREMERQLEKYGVARIPALGERFDPHFHQAMFEVPNDGVPAQTIVEVVQEGYRIGDRVLRAAMVGVSKGGPKHSAQDAASSGSEDGSPPEAA